MARRITVAGWTDCGFYQKAKTALTGLAVIQPDKFNVTVAEYRNKTVYIIRCCHISSKNKYLHYLLVKI
jgi:protein involved in polysaccharide export with SLBB domain